MEVGLKKFLKTSLGNFELFHQAGVFQTRLMSLPPEIRYLKHLKHLRMDYNKLTSLPTEISHVGNLTYDQNYIQDKLNQKDEIGWRTDYQKCIENETALTQSICSDFKFQTRIKDAMNMRLWECFRHHDDLNIKHQYDYLSEKVQQNSFCMQHLRDIGIKQGWTYRAPMI